VTTPTSSPRRSTGRWWTPASRSAVHAWYTGVPAGTVRSGRVTTAPTRVSGPSPSARTRPRKSRSVTIPGGSPRTRTEDARASRIARAASATVASAATHTGGRRTRRSTGSERSAWNVATGECSRLARRRAASPTAK
jgi:hypothetical protein